MTGSRAQLYNGIVLLFVFFSCRLVWGTYQSVRVYQDVWAALHHKPLLSANTLLSNTTSSSAAAASAAAGKSALPLHTGVMIHAGEEFVPLWLAFTYLGSNIILNTLNFYWFGKMIETVRKRFQPAKETKRKEKAVVSRSTGIDGKKMVGVDEVEVVRRRKEGAETPVPAGI